MSEKNKPNIPNPGDDDHEKTKRKETLSEVMNRMETFDTPFLLTILGDTRSHTWKTAARIVLEGRMADPPKSNPDNT